MSYAIITDAGSDLPYEYAKKHNVKILSMKYYVGDSEYDSYRETNNTAWLADFYSKLRTKESVTTSCVNAACFEAAFEECASKGQDFICISFSSAISATWEMAMQSLEKIKDRYPNRKMYVVDSKAASLGCGLFVDYIVKKRDSGMGIDEVRSWAEANKLNICHWFTVDDLFFLKRGGRVSATTAIAGTVLGIKPVLHVDNEGRLINVSKIRGRRASLDALVDRMEQYAVNPKEQTVFISHGDCLEDAKYVEKKIRERLGTKHFNISYVCPLIGAHSGPGTVALFFFGEKR